MGRITGVWVDNLEIKSLDEAPQAPGIRRQFDELRPAKQIDAAQIQGFVNELYSEMGYRHRNEEGVLFTSGDYKLTYNLVVRAPASSIAKAKSRTYVRANNPFEAEIINVERPDLDQKLGLRNIYHVSASVVKN